MAAIEQDGYHLPVDMDKRACFHVCAEAVRRRPDLLLNTPLLAYGFNGHNMSSPALSASAGTSSSSAPTTAAVVVGDPRRASAAKGRKIIEWVVEGLIELAEDFKRIPIKPHRNHQYRSRR